jgi:hypothetical protein
MSAANAQLRAFPSPRKSTAQVRARGLHTPAFVTPAMMRRLKSYGATECVERGRLLTLSDCGPDPAGARWCYVGINRQQALSPQQ